MNKSVYLVMEPIQVIATDLAMHVQEYDPSAMVLIAHSPEAACEVLRSVAAVRFAFVHVAADKFGGTDLALALHVRGARIVFSGTSPDRNNSEKLVLDWPVSAETSAVLLMEAERMNAA